MSGMPVECQAVERSPSGIGDRRARALAEVDRGASSTPAGTGVRTPPRRTRPPRAEALDRGGGRAARDAAEAGVGEREPARPGQPVLRGGRRGSPTAPRRSRSRAAASRPRRAPRRRGRRGPRTPRPRPSGRGSACAVRRQASAIGRRRAREGPGAVQDEAHPGERLVDARRARRGRRAGARGAAPRRARRPRRRCGRRGSAGGRSAGREPRHELARVPVRAVEEPGAGHHHRLRPHIEIEPLRKSVLPIRALT